MSQLTDLKALLLDAAFRAALNVHLAAEGLREVGVPAVAHRDLLSLVEYAPKLPALAVELTSVAGQRLGSDEDYRQTAELTLVLAYADTTQAAARSLGLQYADGLRAAAMESLLAACDAGTAGVRTARYVRSDPEGSLFANDQGVVCRWVTVSLRVQFDGLVTEV